MKNFFQINISHEVTLDEIRKALLRKILIVLNVFGIPVMLLGAYEAFTLELYYTGISYLIIYSPVIIITIFRNKLSYKSVALIIILLALILAILNLIAYGSGGGGIPILFLAVVLATAFLGIEKGLYVLAISILSMIIAAYLYVQKIISLDISLDHISTNTLSWITSIGVVALLGSIIAISFGIIQKKMIQGLELSQQKTEELEKYKESLEELVKERTTELNEKNIKYKKSQLALTYLLEDVNESRKEMQELNEKINLKSEELVEALQQEKELNEMKTRFVSMASHEFRTPLGAITFASGFIKKYWNKISEKDRNAKFNKIDKQVKHMTTMLDDLLTFGKAEAGKIANNPKAFALNDFFKPIIEEVYSQTNNTHQIKLTDNTENCNLFIDEKLGRNIFINLFNNAIKFSPDKSKIDFYVEKKEKTYIFKIKDYGIGIAEKDLESIFAPFNRGSNVETIQGTGLGLSIVKESCDIIKGTIKIESKIGEGTCFIVELPILI